MKRAVLCNRASRAARGTFAAAFTLVELLVVVAVFVLILAVAMPAFSSMLYSSEQSLAENALRVGLTAGRDAAARSAGGEDGAALFTYQPGGRISIIPCVKVGDIVDVDPVSGGNVEPELPREVFAPIPEIEPVQLPLGWSVRGYASKGMIGPDTPLNPAKNDWYEKTTGRLYPDTSSNWVFPESHFFNQSDDTSGSPPRCAIDGNNRQSFMVRFEGGTGALKSTEGVPVVVVLPSAATKFRTVVSPWKDHRADLATDLRRFAREAISLPIYARAKFPSNDRLKMVGYLASDVVMARSVGQVAVYNERRLANAMRARTDRYTGSIYALDPASPATWRPAYVKDASGAAVDQNKVNAWIEGRYTEGGKPIPSDARIFTVSRYLGDVYELVAFGG